MKARWLPGRIPPEKGRVMAGVLGELTIPEDALVLLRQHGDEAAFQTVLELVREVHPDLLRWEVFIQEDPDVDGRTWVGLRLVLPPQTTYETLHERRRRLSERLVQRVPLDALGRLGFPVSCAIGEG
jgi:hypothetical protein